MDNMTIHMTLWSAPPKKILPKITIAKIVVAPRMRRRKNIVNGPSVRMDE